eukprot:6290240-Ditylum_brightwellii.AAC.1
MRHPNGTKVFHHIDKAQYFEDPTGLLKVVAVTKDNLDFAQSKLAMLPKYVVTEYGEDAKK